MVKRAPERCKRCGFPVDYDATVGGWMHTTPHPGAHAAIPAAKRPTATPGESR